MVRRYSYDGNNNLIQSSSPDTGLVEYQYDKLKNVIKKTINNDKYIKYKYHEKNNNLTEITYSDNTPATTYSYDSEGKILAADKGNVGWRYKYDSNNNLTSGELLLSDIEGVEHKFNLKYTYDGYNNITSITYPDNSIFDYEPNAFGEPSRVSKYVNNISYHPSGQLQGLEYDNSLRLLNTFDYSQRPITSRINDLTYNYKYDSSNNILQIQTSDNFHKDLNFTYDTNGRIESADGPWGHLNYFYDINDNITKIVNQNRKLANDDKYFNYDKNNHLVGISSDINSKMINSRLWKYDKSGFLTSDDDNNYSYDLDGNLWRIKGKIKSIIVMMHLILGLLNTLRMEK